MLNIILDNILREVIEFSTWFTPNPDNLAKNVNQVVKSLSTT
ncbi:MULTISPECIES: hypothetical protein [Nostocales]|nr:MULTISPECIES: hypothetical protein [Nostocales]MDK2457842.1 hypothetical protein [Aphanizomenon sp. PH219]